MEHILSLSRFSIQSASLCCPVTPSGGDIATGTSNVTTADAPAPSETVGSHQAPLPMTADTKPRTGGRGTQRVKSFFVEVLLLSLTIEGGKRDP